MRQLTCFLPMNEVWCKKKGKIVPEINHQLIYMFIKCIILGAPDVRKTKAKCQQQGC